MPRIDSMPSDADLDVLCTLLREVAREEILPNLGKTRTDTKPDGSILTPVDLGVQQRLSARLAERWPRVPLLGEEMEPDRQAELLAASDAGVWCLDPLDGTGNFAAGIPYYCTSLALIHGARSVLGIVYDPERDECFSAARGKGARLNGRPLRIPRPAGGMTRANALIDFKRLTAPLAHALATRPPFRSQRNFGAVALDWCWLAAGRGQLYLHGGQKLWDYAAGSLIHAEAGGAGGVFVGIEGAPALRDSLAPRVALAAVDEGLFSEWRDWLRNNDR